MGSLSYSKANVGKRIRSARQSQNISIIKLAKEIGVSKSLISQVERGEVYPSIQTLEKMSAAMHVPLGEFFAIEESTPYDPSSAIVKSGMHKIILMPGTNNRYHILTRSLGNNPFEFLLIEFPPHESKTQVDLSAHKGEQCFYVLEGALTLTINDREYQVSVGDSGSIASNNKHSFYNGSGKTAKVIVVTTDAVL